MVTVSVVSNGKTFTTTFKAKGAKIEDIVKNANTAIEAGGGTAKLDETVVANTEIGRNKYGKTIETANGEKALTFQAADEGVDGQIAGLTISITDQQGNINKSANAALDNFSESIRAENQS